MNNYGIWLIRCRYPIAIGTYIPIARNHNQAVEDVHKGHSAGAVEKTAPEATWHRSRGLYNIIHPEFILDRVNLPRMGGVCWELGVRVTPTST